MKLRDFLTKHNFQNLYTTVGYTVFKTKYYDEEITIKHLLVS